MGLSWFMSLTYAPTPAWSSQPDLCHISGPYSTWNSDKQGKQAHDSGNRGYQYLYYKGSYYKPKIFLCIQGEIKNSS